MSKDLVMSFMNEQGKKISIRVNDVKEGVTAAEVSTVMDTIITKNLFQSSGGDLTVKDSAQLVDKSTEALKVK